MMNNDLCGGTVAAVIVVPVIVGELIDLDQAVYL